MILNLINKFKFASQANSNKTDAFKFKLSINFFFV